VENALRRGKRSRARAGGAQGKAADLLAALADADASEASRSSLQDESHDRGEMRLSSTGGDADGEGDEDGLAGDDQALLGADGGGDGEGADAGASEGSAGGDGTAEGEGEGSAGGDGFAAGEATGAAGTNAAASVTAGASSPESASPARERE
jgi:hypothetical protein